MHAFYIYRQAEALEGKNILFFCVNIGVTSIIKRDELSGDFSNVFLHSVFVLHSFYTSRQVEELRGMTFLLIWKVSNRAALAEMFGKLDCELVMN